MTDAGKDINKHLELLIQATESILRGEYDQWGAQIDVEGMFSVLAQKINALIVNMKNIELPLTSAGNYAPSAVRNAKNVIELMAHATSQVLDSSDRLASEVDALASSASYISDETGEFKNRLTNLKSNLFDIIASQSYQDVARQKMERLINDLGQIRDWLIEVLVILNIRKNMSPENLEQKAKLLRGVSGAETPDEMKQDLVDELLSEFGF